MMKNSVRRISALMAIAMVLTLLVAFPAMTASAEDSKATVSAIAMDTSLTTTVDRDGSGAIELLIDGTSAHNTGWVNGNFSRQGTGKNTAYILTLGAIKNISKIVVCSASDNGGSAGGVTSVSVELSSDGTTWVAAAGTTTSTSVSGSSLYAGDITVALDEATDASYVRITVCQTKYLLSIDEIEVYATVAAAELGSAANPEVITSVDSITTTLAADDADGYFYSFTAAAAGTYTFGYMYPDEGVTLPASTLTVVNGETTKTLTSTDALDNFESLKIAVDAGDVLSINLKVDDASAATIGLYGNYTAIPGTLDNPYSFDVDMEGNFTSEEIPANSTVYFQIYGNGGYTLETSGMASLTIGETVCEADADGKYTVVLPEADFFTPTVLTVTTGDAAATYTFKLTAPVGSWENPAVIEELAPITVEILETNFNGMYYTYTATEAGIFSILDITTTEGTACTFVLSNETSGVYADSGVTTIEVAEGDVLSIQVFAHLPEDSWTSVTSTVGFTPAIVPPVELGDVNADGSVDNIDAALVLKYDAALSELTDDQIALADVNGDGEVDNIDAAMILKLDAGLIEEF